MECNQNAHEKTQCGYISTGPRSVDFCLNYHLPPYCMYASKFSDETVQAHLSVHFTFFFINWLIQFHNIEPLYTDDSLTRTFANSEDPDEMPHNVTFHQGLHFFKDKK